MGKSLAPKTLENKLGGLSAIKGFLGIDKTSPALEQSFKTVTKIKRELPPNIEIGSVPHFDISPFHYIASMKSLSKLNRSLNIIFLRDIGKLSLSITNKQYKYIHYSIWYSDNQLLLLVCFISYNLVQVLVRTIIIGTTI